MTKQDTLFHLAETITYVKALYEVPEAIWREPMKPGKWSMAETIAHFTPWDQFVLTKRIPYLLTGESLPKGPEVEEINVSTAQQCRNKLVEQIIAEFATTRTDLIESIQQIDDSIWEKPIAIGEKKIILSVYFKGLDDHDLHHLKQIDEYLKQSGIEKPFNFIMM